MKNSLLIYLLLNISLLYIVAAILTEVRPLRIILKRRVRSVPNQLCLGLIFGLLSISGTYTGMNFQGAVVNTRVVSTVAAGLVGGPLSGLCAGALSGPVSYTHLIPVPGFFPEIAGRSGRNLCRVTCFREYCCYAAVGFLFRLATTNFWNKMMTNKPPIPIRSVIAPLSMSIIAAPKEMTLNTGFSRPKR